MYFSNRKAYISLAVILIMILTLSTISFSCRVSNIKDIVIDHTEIPEDKVDSDKGAGNDKKPVLEGDETLQDFTGTLYPHYTFHSPDGNKVTDLKGDLSSYVFTDIQLEGSPVWVVSGRAGEKSVWVVMLEDGKVQVFLIKDKNGIAVDEYKGGLPGFDSPVPPVLVADDNDFTVIGEGYYADNHLSHPVMIGSSGQFAALTPEGSLEIYGENTKRLPVNALPDSRPVTDKNGLIFILTDPTDEYAHGIQGDRYEAGSITILDSSNGYKLVNKIEMKSDTVIESLYPIAYDMDGDDESEIIVTLSNSSTGAWISVFKLNGDILMKGPDIGKGNRWRHQLAVAPFGPEGEIELVDVLTPHIGGVVEFYRPYNDSLEVVSSIGGYSSHQIGSRNLDTALAGDYDNDGQSEIMVPFQDFSGLGIIEHSDNGAVAVLGLESGGKISTNISSAADSYGGLMFAAGRIDGILRIWHK